MPQPTMIETYRMLRKLGIMPSDAKHQSAAFHARRLHVPYQNMRAILDQELGGRTRKELVGGVL